MAKAKEKGMRAPEPQDEVREVVSTEGVAPGQRWKNRVTGTGAMDPGQLLANPKNWRIHPEHQQKAMIGVLDQVGWVAEIIVNKRTGTIIDGHMRVSIALQQEEATVPVSIVDLSEEEEDLILATFDTVGAHAAPDHEKRVELLNEVATRTDARAVSAMLEAARSQSEKILSRQAEREAMHQAQETRANSVWRLNENPVFVPVKDPKANWLEFPDLLDGDKLATHVPTRTWNGVEVVLEQEAPDFLYIYGNPEPPKLAKLGTLGFYTEDYRFEVIWNEFVSVTERFLDYGWKQIIMPDFSTWTDDPLMVQAWSYYRSAWCARYWQECGIKIIPSLAGSGNEKTWEWNKLVFPKRPPLIACQVRHVPAGDAQAHEELASWLADRIEEIEPEAVLMYGDSGHREWLEPMLPEGVRYSFVPGWTNVRRALTIAKTKKERGAEAHGGKRRGRKELGYDEQEGSTAKFWEG